jgi:hypothetical protein
VGQSVAGGQRNVRRSSIHARLLRTDCCSFSVLFLVSADHSGRHRSAWQGDREALRRCGSQTEGQAVKHMRCAESPLEVADLAVSAFDFRIPQFVPLFSSQTHELQLERAYACCLMQLELKGCACDDVRSRSYLK